MNTERTTSWSNAHRSFLWPINAAVAMALSLSPALAGASPVTISGPVAAPITDVNGTGLCAASAVSLDKQKDFGQLTSKSTFNPVLNDFIEDHAADRVESVVRTVLDLSNNNGANDPKSYGDFIDAMSPTCKTGGCGFFINDNQTAFGSRLRGFLNVTDDLVGKPIHFGFFTDDGVSLVLFNKVSSIHEIVTRNPQNGASTWRSTNAVTFAEAGLYPVEILYVQLAESASLEMSYYVGDYADFELPVNDMNSKDLKEAGFKLFEPNRFFQTLSGNPSFPDVNQCAQCDRQYVNSTGSAVCVSGHYCNEAALCVPCDEDFSCGLTCSPCGGATPFCVAVNGENQCGECQDDFDCKEGFACDPVKHECACAEPGACGSPGAGGPGGAGGAGAGGEPADEPTNDNGCGCRVAGGDGREDDILTMLLALASAASIRRRGPRV